MHNEKASNRAEHNENALFLADYFLLKPFHPIVVKNDSVFIAFNFLRYGFRLEFLKQCIVLVAFYLQFFYCFEQKTFDLYVAGLVQFFFVEE